MYVGSNRRLGGNIRKVVTKLYVHMYIHTHIDGKRSIEVGNVKALAI